MSSKVSISGKTISQRNLLQLPLISQPNLTLDTINTVHHNNLSVG